MHTRIVHELPAVTTFGRALRFERKRLGLTQRELAQRLETSQQNVAGWEVGKALPGVEFYDAMIALFGKTSPLSALPPREARMQIRLSREPINLAARHWADEDDNLISDAKMRQDWSAPAQQTAKTFSGALPEALRVHADRRVDSSGARSYEYRADYLSARVCLCLCFPADAEGVLQSARGGLQQLALHRALLEGDAARERVYLLAVVVTDPSMIMGPGSRLAQVMFEASTLGVEVQLTDDAASLAGVVGALEQGADRQDPAKALLKA